MILFSIFIITVLVAVMIRVYNKLTCGICMCSKHLVGKVVIVTGANTGIGYETAKDLADRGARVILACRSEARGTVAQAKIVAETGNSDVHYRHLDLASLASVRTFAENILANENRLDILINNAGLYEAENVKTEDGLLYAMQCNHFGHFLLTNLLLPLLKSSAPSRIINVSSLAYIMGEIDFENLNITKPTLLDIDILNKFQVYSNTTLCNVMMAVELEQQLRGTGVTINSLHPGIVKTDIINRINAKWVILGNLIYKTFGKTCWEGAQTTIYLAVSPEVSDVSGAYFSDCKQETLTTLAQDTDIARKLWEVSEKLVKLK